MQASRHTERKAIELLLLSLRTYAHKFKIRTNADMVVLMQIIC